VTVAGIGAQRTMLGLFRFWNVPNGSYTITPWWTALNPKAANPATNGAVTLPAVISVMVRGTAWLDNNGDGIRQPWETPLAGVPVTLVGQSMVTDEQGRFAFYGMAAGNYTLTANLPTGLTAHIGSVVVTAGRGAAIGIAAQTASGFKIYLPVVAR
jgi:hypothetical protein